MSDSWWHRIGYAVTRVAARLFFVIAFHFRCLGRHHFPSAEGALICANHQSHFDPMLVGLVCDRRMSYLARKSLFRNPAFSYLLRFYGAIPLDREGTGLGGLKESLKRLRKGEMVLIFPEGTRSEDGRIQPLQAGFCALARRAKVPLVPVALAGAYDAWPRRQTLPRPGVIRLVVGPPISPGEVADLEDSELVAELDRRIRHCHRRAGRMIQASAAAGGWAS